MRATVFVPFSSRRPCAMRFFFYIGDAADQPFARAVFLYAILFIVRTLCNQ